MAGDTVPGNWLGCVWLSLRTSPVNLSTAETWARCTGTGEGREPAEIARRLGIPAGTVRWRVSEGLALLRRTLDRTSGGRERWLPLYLPLAGLPAREVAAATGTAAPWSGALTKQEPGRTGSYRLDLWGRLEERGTSVELYLPLEIVAGPNPLALAPDSAPLSGVLMPGTSPANLQLRASLGGGGLWVAPLEP